MTSYQLAVQDAFAFKRKKWYYMILDEAQNIKNFQSQRWQTLINFNSQRRLLLTGTPLQVSKMYLTKLEILETEIYCHRALLLRCILTFPCVTRCSIEQFDGTMVSLALSYAIHLSIKKRIFLLVFKSHEQYYRGKQ